MLRISRYTIGSSRIPEGMDGFRAAVMADLHDCCVGKDNSNIRDTLLAERPECLLLAGDMITEGYSGLYYQHAIDLITQLTEHIPVYYGMGNHELRWSNKPDDAVPKTFRWYKDYLTKRGVRFLVNQSIHLGRSGLEADLGKEDDSVRLTGLSLPGIYYRKKRIEQLTPEVVRHCVGPASDKSFELLLAHTPQFFHAYVQWGADLAIAGHFHGGNVRLPLLGGVISPYIRLFPKYDMGQFTDKVTGRQMIVTAGVGSHTIPRIFNPPEVVILTLRHRRVDAYS